MSMQCRAYSSIHHCVHLVPAVASLSWAVGGWCAIIRLVTKPPSAYQLRRLGAGGCPGGRPTTEGTTTMSCVSPSVGPGQCDGDAAVPVASHSHSTGTLRTRPLSGDNGVDDGKAQSMSTTDTVATASITPLGRPRPAPAPAQHCITEMLLSGN